MDFDDTMLDPMEMFFINELLEHAQAEPEPDYSLRSGPLQKDGKLILRVSDIEGIVASRFGFRRCCECAVTVQSMTQTSKFPLSSQDPEEMIFDVFEYYGAMKVYISVSVRGLFSTSKLGELSLDLRDIVLLQEKHEASRRTSEMDVNPPGQVSNSCREEFWGCSKIVSLSPTTRRNGQQSIRVRLQARYVPLHRCVTCRTRMGGVIRSELHHAAQYGSGKLMSELVQLLARKGILRPALALREELPGGDVGTKRFSVLDIALASGNINAVRVLLQRAGNLCFLNTPYELVGAPSVSSGSVGGGRSARNFIPHASCVDKSYFALVRLRSGDGSKNDDETSLSKGSDINAFYGCAVHAAVLGGVGCLLLLLRFLRKYSSVVSGWERAQTFADMVNWRGNRLDGYSPLMLACEKSDTECVRTLLQLTEVNSGDPIVCIDSVSSLNGHTALMLSCAVGNVDIVNLLLARKSKIDGELPVSADGTTCRNNPGSRHVAERYFTEKSPVSLLACLPLARDTDGRQCVAIAAANGHAEVVETLIARGVSYSSVDVDGRTALHLAAANGHVRVCEVIIRAEAMMWERFPPPLPALPTEAEPVKGSSYEFDDKDKTEKLTVGGAKLVRCQEKNFFPNTVTYSAGYKSNKSRQEGALVHSLSHMSRRPDAMTALDIRGHRPADLASMNGHDDVVSLLLIAVREVYGEVHAPLLSSSVASPKAACSKEDADSHLSSGDKSSRGMDVSVSAGAKNEDVDPEKGSDDAFDDFAEDSAYTFATTLRFPTPPASPKILNDKDDA